MPFFLPGRLIEFEYLEPGEPDKEYEQMAKSYRSEIDFAFFVVNFGYSKADYEALTQRERAFIYKAWENKLVNDTTQLRNAVLNAINNAIRKKGKKFLALWKKRQKKLDKDVAKDNLKIVTNIEDTEGKGWIEKIYAANGIKPKRKKGGGRK